MTNPKNSDRIDLPEFRNGSADEQPMFGVIDWLLAAIMAVATVTLLWWLA